LENTLMPRWVLTITATRMAGILLLSLVVATVDTLSVVLWRVCASHYRERLPVSAFLYLYPRLNSYGTASGQHADQLSIQPSRNCVPRSRPRADAKRFTIVPSSRLRQLAVYREDAPLARKDRRSARDWCCADGRFQCELKRYFL